MNHYQFQSLTAELANRDSPLKHYLSQRFPNSRPLRRNYADSAGPIVVDAGGSAPGTLGSAFDFVVRFRLDPRYDAHLATIAFGGRPALLDAVREVVDFASESARAAEFDRLALYRAAWALALCTEVYRIGGVPPRSPLAELFMEGRFTAESLLDCASPTVISEMLALDSVAIDALLPYVATAKHLSLGPTFAASELCSADADFIADGCLVEMKTRLGEKSSRAGGRRDVLKLDDLYQMIGYALFDTDNEFEIGQVAMYSARFGHYAAWPLSDLLDELAGEKVDIDRERQAIWSLLGGPSGKRSRP